MKIFYLFILLVFFTNNVFAACSKLLSETSSNSSFISLSTRSTPDQNPNVMSAAPAANAASVSGATANAAPTSAASAYAAPANATPAPTNATPANITSATPAPGPPVSTSSEQNLQMNTNTQNPTVNPGLKSNPFDTSEDCRLYGL